MKYVTQDGFAARYTEEELIALTDRDGDGEPDEDVWQAAAEDAEAEVDAALAARYTLPLEHTPNAVKWAAYTCLRARLNAHVSEDHPARVQYDDARTWLRRVSQGEIGLGLPQERAEEVGPVRAAVRGGGRQYTSDFFRRYRP